MVLAPKNSQSCEDSGDVNELLGCAESSDTRICQFLWAGMDSDYEGW